MEYSSVILLALCLGIGALLLFLPIPIKVYFHYLETFTFSVSIVGIRLKSSDKARKVKKKKDTSKSKVRLKKSARFIIAVMKEVDMLKRGTRVFSSIQSIITIDSSAIRIVYGDTDAYALSKVQSNWYSISAFVTNNKWEFIPQYGRSLLEVTATLKASATLFSIGRSFVVLLYSIPYIQLFKIYRKCSGDTY